MARDDELMRLGGFPAGLNNRAGSTNGPTDENGGQIALREAVNVSLSTSGSPVRRPGQAMRVNGKAHSLVAFGAHLIGWVDGELRAYLSDGTGGLTFDRVLKQLPDRFCTYATDDFELWWSNGVDAGRIDADLNLHAFWIDTPAAPVLNAIAGTLPKGRYEISVTAVDADGRESGGSGAVGIALQSGAGVHVTLPMQPDGAVKWRLYVSPPDGEVLYEQAELPISAHEYVLTGRTPGASLETQWLHPLLPCQCLRYGHSRLFGLAGNVLIWSEEYRLGLMHPDNHIVLGHEATLLEPVGDGTDGAGVWIADHKRTYFMAGADPATWQQQARYPHAAVPGSSTTLPGSYFGLDAPAVAYWMARNGVPCIGLPSGQLIPLREDALALPVDAERGATGLMLFDGICQLLTTTISASANMAAASDSVDATVTRRNHRTT